MDRGQPELANEGELRLEGIAMNIVHQIGDALYDALPPEIAHEYFVAARQATNDAAIDFAKKLLTSEIEKAKVEACIETVKAISDVGKDDIHWSDVTQESVLHILPEHFRRSTADIPTGKKEFLTFLMEELSKLQEEQ